MKDSDNQDTQSLFARLDALRLRFVLGIKATKVELFVLEVQELHDKLTKGIKEWLGSERYR